MLPLLALALPLLQAQDPGPVVLLGERADAALVDELTRLEGASVLLRLADEAARDCAEQAATLGGGARTTCLELRRDDLLAVDDDALALAVRSARHVAVGPGSLRDWFRTLWPGRNESQLVGALWEAHRGGAVLVGRGVGAGFLSAATVIDGPDELGERERNPHRLEGPRSAWAAGFQPWAIRDTHGAAGGRLERLVRVLIDERLRLGVWLEPRSALVFDAAAARFVARGEDGVLLLDLRNARRKETALYRARLSRLGPGDAWVRRLHAVSPAAGGSEAEVEDRSERRSVDDVFAVDALVEALAAFDSAVVPRRLILDDGLRLLTLEVDEDAVVWRRETGRTTLAHLALDVEPSER